MATFFSDEFTRFRAGRNYRSNELQGKLRVLKWDFASLAASTLADIFMCGIIRKDERVLFGREFHSAMGGTATGAYSTFALSADRTNIGAIITAGKYLAATSFVAAGQTDLANTLTLNALAEETSADVALCCVNAGSAMATAGRIAGFLVLVAD